MIPLSPRLPATLLVLGLLLGPLSAFAQPLRWLGPSAPGAPDGFAVALAGARGTPEVTAEGGTLAPLEAGPGLTGYLVTPRPGAREVRLIARAAGDTAEARYPVGPPAAAIQLSLEPAAPVKGRDESATLTVRLLRPDGSPDDESASPVVRANVGQVEGLRRVGPGHYEARYVLPPTRYPEVAVLVALSPWPHPDAVHGAFASRRVPLATAIELPGKTERNAQMSIEIAGIRYGPVQSGSDGRFKLPVVVPPGHGFAKGTAVDRLGNRRVRRIDLHLPPTDQLACVMNPTRLPADGQSRARVLCAASDPYGGEVKGATIALSARQGRVSAPVEHEGGVLEWIYTAPDTLSPEAIPLEAAWRVKGRASREALAVELSQGPPAKVTIALDEPLVHPAGKVGLTLRVFDPLGRPRPKSTVTLEAPHGTFDAVVERRPGELTSAYRAAAEAPVGRVVLRAHVVGPPAEVPARLAAFGVDGQLAVALTDLAGLPVPNERLRVGDGEVTTGADGVARAAMPSSFPLEISSARWPGLRLTVHRVGERLFPPASVPAATATAELEVGPSLPVNVRLEIAGRTATYWVESPSGAVLEGRAVHLEVHGGKEGRGIL